MSCNVFLDLPNGKMPALGYGTWGMFTEEQLGIGLHTALETGYRHIDTAQIYDNEQLIGKVLKKWIDGGRLKREEIFLTTKVAPSVQPDKVEEVTKESLRKLQVDYVDLYLIHLPVVVVTKDGVNYGSKDANYMDIWKKLEEQYDKGKAKHIGISNFNQKQIEHMMKNCRIKPYNLQIEMHIYMQQIELVNFCKKNNITVVAYAPLGSSGYNAYLKGIGRATRDIPNFFENPVVKEISAKRSKTPSQIMLRYLIQIGVAPIPKTVSPARIKENFQVFGFSLNKTEMDALLGIDVGPSYRIFDMEPYGINVLQHPDFPF